MAIAGDICKSGLGLSHENMQQVTEQVNYVIHSAACISFFEHIHLLLAENYQVSASLLLLRLVPFVWQVTRSTTN